MKSDKDCDPNSADPSFGGGAPPDGGQERIDAIDRFRYGLRHLQQRWENGLALNNASLIEKYLSGRFSVVLYCHPADPKMNEVSHTAGAYGGSYVGHTIVVFIDNIKPGDALGDKDGDQEPVFITTVEFVEEPKKTVPAFVRAYLINDEFANASSGHLYGSIPSFLFSLPANQLSLGAKGSYKFLPIVSHRKSQARIPPAENLVDGVIQSCPEIMDCISKEKHKLGWQRIDGDYAECLASIRVILKAELAEIRFEERFPSGMKLVDVLIGPFTL